MHECASNECLYMQQLIKAAIIRIATIRQYALNIIALINS